MNFPVIMTVNVNPEVLDEYIEHVKQFNYYFDKRHECDSYRLKAMEHHEKLNMIQANLGWKVLMALESYTGKTIPVEK